MPVRVSTRNRVILNVLTSFPHLALGDGMAGLADQNGHDALEEKLGRLSNKPGVRASIILDRASGAILKTSGQSSALRTAKARDAASAASLSNEVPAAEASEAQGVDEFAAMIWNYVSVSGQLVQEADKEDELRLLRLRTKKQEIVIVPDAKYVLAVIHDTPTA